MTKAKHNKTRLEREADKTVKPEVEKLGKQAVAWLKQQAVEQAGEYRGDRHYHCGDIVRGLGLGNGWDSREKAYPGVMRGLRRAEELGFVEVQRHGSPIGFRYVGPEVDAAQKAAEKAKKDARRRLEVLVNKTRIKGIELDYDRYSSRDSKITMTPAAFQTLLKKAGIA